MTIRFLLQSGKFILCVLRHKEQNGKRILIAWEGDIYSLYIKLYIH